MPWDQRIRPGDLSPGDLLAPPAEDPRLVPGYVLSGDPAVDDVAAEVGFGRRQVLSEWGVPTPPSGGTTVTTVRSPRWHAAPGGSAATAAGLLPLAGTLGTMFGVRQRVRRRRSGGRFHLRLWCTFDTRLPPVRAHRCNPTHDDGVLDVSENPESPLPPEPVAAEGAEPGDS